MTSTSAASRRISMHTWTCSMQDELYEDLDIVKSLSTGIGALISSPGISDMLPSVKAMIILSMYFG